MNKESYHKAILKAAFAGYWQVDMSGHILEVNDAYCRMSGYTEQELLTMKIADIEAIDDPSVIQARIGEVVAEGKANFESKHRRKDGTLYDIEISLQYSGDCIVGFGRDITERKQVENVLRVEQDRLRTVLDTIGDPVFVKDNDHRFTLANNAFYEMLGLAEEAVIGKTMAESLPAEEMRCFMKVDRRVLDTGIPDLSEEFLTAKGVTKTIITRKTRFIDESGNKFVVGVIRDITERKRMEEALRDSKQRLELALEGGGLGLWDWNPQAGVVVYDDRWAQMLEYAPEEVEPTVDFFKQHVHPDDLPSVLERLVGHVEGRLPFYESEHRFRTKSGKWLWIVDRGRIAKRDSDGRVVRVTGVIADITERKQLEERLHQSEKLDAIGQLAGGIAHDFNNMLAGIIGYAEMISNDPHSPDIERFAGNILESGNRSAALVRQLLAFARKGEVVIQPVDLTKLVHEIGNVCASTFDKRIRVVVTTDNGAIVMGDHAQLHSALLNLAINARDAMTEGGTLTFTTTIIHDCHALPSLEGECLKIEVSDTGTGMDEATKKRIFEPFFTTKGIGKGTGLGLASVYGTVMTHKGTITVSSVAGKGSTFTIMLPVSQVTAQKPTVRKAVRAARVVTIMVVDDEERIRELMQDILEGLGYVIVAFEDPADALHHYKHHYGEIALSLLDMSMPTMDGASLFAAMKNIDPEVKALIVSGHSFNESIASVVAAGALGHIAKPFDTVTISEKVSEALNEEENQR